VITTADVFLRDPVAVGLCFAERGLLEPARLFEPALDATKLLERTAAAARKREGNDNGANDGPHNGADDPAEEREVAREAADNAANGGGAP
jgi:hypothetical protein